MDNSNQQPTHTVNHHTHVYDPELSHVHHSHPNVPSNSVSIEVNQQQQSVSAPSAPGLNPDGSPIKRRPGRPKGSTKKNLLAGEILPPKIKRPVGRPRKDGLPAGSVGPSKLRRESTAGMVAPYPAAPIAAFQYGFSLGGPIPGVALPPPGVFQIDPAVQQPGENDWANLARANSNAFLNTLLIALHAPNPVSTAGPTVEEAFKSHLISLAPNQQQTQQPIPSLYSLLKTFWLPSSPAYFGLTASTRTPSEHRFLYWDPQPLVFNGILCPSCSTPLINKGRISSGPIKIYDIRKPFFIVGCEYVCRSNQCINTTPEGRKFASTDPAILRSLPAKLKDEFPAKLLLGDGDIGSGPNVWNWRALGVSTSLWNLVMGGLRTGLRKEVILGLIWAVQNGVPDFPPSDGAQLQPQHVVPQAAQQSQVQDVVNQADDRMDEDDDNEEEEEDECARTLGGAKNGSDTAQASASTTFSDAYGAAWNENSATTGEPSQKQTQAAVPQTPSSQPPTIMPASTPSQPSIQPAPLLPSYKPFPGYPFPPYPYMPHPMVNPVPAPIPPPLSTSSSATPVEASASAPAGSSAAPSGSSKRSPRHCSKCGSQECKGKGGRSFCTNPCQDCGHLECKGRNSRRPDKKCTEGWQ